MVTMGLPLWRGTAMPESPPESMGPLSEIGSGEARAPRRSAVAGVVPGEDVWAGAQLGFAKPVERAVDGVEKGVQVAVIGLDKQEASDDLAGGMALLQIGQGRDPVAGIVIGRELAQPQDRAVMLDHGLDRAGRVIGGD